MNRRAFLSLSAFTPFAHLLPVYGQTRDVLKPPEVELKADVVILGAGLGGVACALAAARNGLKVILTEEHEWIGGQLTSQAVPPDEHPWIEERGSTKTYRSFRSRVREYYRRNYPLTPAAAKEALLNPGLGNVSKLCHEPRVALAVLLEMLAPHIATRRVRLLQPYQVRFVDADGDRITYVEVWRSWGARDRIGLQATYFVDATETGEAIAAGGVEHVTGAEAREDTREPHAAPQSQPRNHQAFTVCFAMDYEADKDNTIEKPLSYASWRAFEPKLHPEWPGPLLSWETSDPITLKTRALGFDPTGPLAKGLNLWTYRRILAKSNFEDNSGLSDVCLVNWPQNDYLLGNLYGTGGDRITHFEGAQELSLCLLYWMQTEAPHPTGRKQGWKGLRLRPDVTGTDEHTGYRGLAMAPYVRESRRIKALFSVTETHVGTDARARSLGKKPGEFTAEQFPDTVGTGCYRIDLHPSSGGNNYIDVSSLPFQIPLGALIPERVENLLPACKNIGTTHITNGCFRLHPVEWSIGEAVGELVAFCTARKRIPRQVRKDAKLLADYQAQLTKAGFDLKWPNEIATSPR
jgi:hypothetical protein